MARPRGAARSRRHAPPLDKPGRSGLLALRRFHDGLQTPALVRFLVRTEKEEIMPRPPRHPQKKSHLETRNFQMRFLFLPNIAANGPRAHPQLGNRDTRHRPPQRNSLIRVIRCYAVRAQHHLSLSRLRGRTNKNRAPQRSVRFFFTNKLYRG